MECAGLRAAPLDDQATTLKRAVKFGPCPTHQLKPARRDPCGQHAPDSVARTMKVVRTGGEQSPAVSLYLVNFTSLRLKCSLTLSRMICESGSKELYILLMNCNCCGCARHTLWNASCSSPSPQIVLFFFGECPHVCCPEMWELCAKPKTGLGWIPRSREATCNSVALESGW